MNIALVGFGKMGQTIARLAQSHHTIKLVIDPDHSGKIGSQLPAGTRFSKTMTDADWSDIDVAIEFSHPSVALENIKALCELRVNTVVGTTGWHERIDQVKSWVKESGIGLLWSSNFSIGVQLFWKTVEQTAQLFNKFDEFDVYGHEFHHREKADAPSGTARTTADILVKTIDRKTEWVEDRVEGKIEPHQLHFSSTRGGFVPGTHSVYFDSPTDTIEITHTARSREGFASGALRSADWIQNKKGFFSIENYLEELLNFKTI